MALNKLRAAFDQVDSSGDGKIDWSEIQACCQQLKINVTHDDFQSFLVSDTDKDEKLGFDEFCLFVRSRLHRVFSEIDANNNGYLEIQEVKAVLDKMSINVSLRKIEAILQSMDSDNDNRINFEEFYEFFGDVPTASLEAVIERWMFGEGLDTGTDLAPTAIPPSDMPLSRFMMAGGLAGVASRTATAPLETIKIISQVRSLFLTQSIYESPLTFFYLLTFLLK